jgi:hypothetical protein
VSAASDELVKRARFLRNAAPQQFEDFCTAFADYTNHQLETLVVATDSLPLAQGHVQQCKKICQMLTEVKHG